MITEGKIMKNGLNSTPKSKRPSPPKGQRNFIEVDEPVLTEGKTKTNRKPGRPKKKPTSPPSAGKSKNELPTEIVKKIRNIDVIPIDKDSILVVHIDVTNLMPERVDSYMETVINRVDSFFKKYEMPYMVVADRGRETVKFESIKKVKK